MCVWVYEYMIWPFDNIIARFDLCSGSIWAGGILFLWDVTFCSGVHRSRRFEWTQCRDLEEFRGSETIFLRPVNYCGPCSVVGITSSCGLDGPGIESRWGEIFRACPDRPWGPPSLLYNGYLVFPGVKSGRGVTLTPHPLLVPWLWKGRAIPLVPL
jgi:hypothetical protein